MASNEVGFDWYSEFQKPVNNPTAKIEIDVANWAHYLWGTLVEVSSNSENKSKINDGNRTHLEDYGGGYWESLTATNEYIILDFVNTRKINRLELFLYPNFPKNEEKSEYRGKKTLKFWYWDDNINDWKIWDTLNFDYSEREINEPKTFGGSYFGEVYWGEFYWGGSKTGERILDGVLITGKSHIVLLDDSGKWTSKIKIELVEIVNQANKWAVCEIEAYESWDISNFLSSYSSSHRKDIYFNRYASSQINLTLLNYDKRFTPTYKPTEAERQNGWFSDIIKPNMRIRAYIGFDLMGAKKYKLEGVYYVSRWEVDGKNQVVSVSADDRIKFLVNKQIELKQILKDYTIEQIIEILGILANISADEMDLKDTYTQIQYFWPTNEQVWDKMQLISEVLGKVKLYITPDNKLKYRYYIQEIPGEWTVTTKDEFAQGEQLTGEWEYTNNDSLKPITHSNNQDLDNWTYKNGIVKDNDYYKVDNTFNLETGVQNYFSLNTKTLGTGTRGYIEAYLLTRIRNNIIIKQNRNQNNLNFNITVKIKYGNFNKDILPYLYSFTIGHIYVHLKKCPNIPFIDEQTDLISSIEFTFNFQNSYYNNIFNVNIDFPNITEIEHYYILEIEFITDGYAIYIGYAQYFNSPYNNSLIEINFSDLTSFSPFNQSYQKVYKYYYHWMYEPYYNKTVIEQFEKTGYFSAFIASSEILFTDLLKYLTQVSLIQQNSGIEVYIGKPTLDSQGNQYYIYRYFDFNQSYFDFNLKEFFEPGAQEKFKCIILFTNKDAKLYKNINFIFKYTIYKYRSFIKNLLTTPKSLELFKAQIKQLDATKFQFYTQTSPDGINWEEEKAVENGNIIKSTPQRYIRWSVIADNTSTLSEILEVTIYYTILEKFTGEEQKYKITWKDALMDLSYTLTDEFAGENVIYNKVIVESEPYKLQSNQLLWESEEFQCFIGQQIRYDIKLDDPCETYISPENQMYLKLYTSVGDYTIYNGETENEYFKIVFTTHPTNPVFVIEPKQEFNVLKVELYAPPYRTIGTIQSIAEASEFEKMLYGKRELTYQNPYIYVKALAEKLANFLLNEYRTPRLYISKPIQIRFCPFIQIGDIVQIIEEFNLHIDKFFEVIGYNHNITNTGANTEIQTREIFI